MAKKPPEYRNPSPIAKALIVALCVYLALTTISLVDSIGLWFWGLPQGAVADVRAKLLTVVAISTVVVFYSTGAMWVAWMRRCHRNVTWFGCSNGYGIGWTIGAWFVPLASLWIPKEITADACVPVDPDDRKRQPLPVLKWWWGLFLADVALDYVQRAAQRGDVTLPPWGWLSVDLVGVALSVTAMFVVVRITERHQLRYQAYVRSLREEVFAEPEAVDPPRRVGAMAAAVVIPIVLIGSVLVVSTKPEGKLRDPKTLATGECFTQASDGYRVVPCEDPHPYQVVGQVTIPGEWTGDDPSFSYGSGRCWEQFEVATGVPSLDTDYQLLVRSFEDPLHVGSSDVHCLVAQADIGDDLTGSLVHPSARIPWEELQPAHCYSSSASFITLVEASCAAAEFRVEKMEPIGQFPFQPYPGDDQVSNAAASFCGEDGLWFAPTADTWTFGDRQIVCVTYFGSTTS